MVRGNCTTGSGGHCRFVRSLQEHMDPWKEASMGDRVQVSLCHSAFGSVILITPKSGAFSIVLSSGGYKDVDNGNTIKYCGTASKDGSVSAGTQQLIKSYHLGKEIRVLRNSAMSVSQSPYRPEKGIRFDGMYRIMSVKLLDAETMMHRFTMERCPGQDPIRYQGPEKRPTKQQLAKLDEL